MVSPRLFALACALGFAIAIPSSALAQDLEQARAHYFDAEFEEAIAAFGQVLASETLTPTAAGEAHRFLAALHALLGDSARAEEHARIAVALNPAVSAPDGAPPEVAELLARAREETGGARSTIVIEPDGPLVLGTETTVRARLTPREPSIGDELVLGCVSGETDVEVGGAPPEVDVLLTPGASEARCEATALTDAGGALITAVANLTVGGERTSSAAEGAGGGGDDTVIWAVLGGVGAALLVAGAIIVAVVLSQPTAADLGPPQIEGW